MAGMRRRTLDARRARGSRVVWPRTGRSLAGCCVGSARDIAVMESGRTVSSSPIDRAWRRRLRDGAGAGQGVVADGAVDVVGTGRRFGAHSTRGEASVMPSL